MSREGNGGAAVEPKLDPVAAEVVPATGEIRPARTIPVELKGGPLTHQLELLVDGKQIPHVSKARLEAIAGDALRLYTEQVKLIANLSVQVAGWDKSVQAHAVLRSETDDDPATQKSLIGAGSTLRAAVEDLLSQIDAEELDA